MGQLLSKSSKNPNGNQASESARLLLKNNNMIHHVHNSKVSMSSVASTAELSPDQSPVPAQNRSIRSNHKAQQCDRPVGMHTLFVGSFTNWALLSFDDNDKPKNNRPTQDQAQAALPLYQNLAMNRDARPRQDKSSFFLRAPGATPNTSRSQPVKCPPRRPQDHDDFCVMECSSHHQGDHDDDVQYLRRLYELRTWDMYLRITEARKRQRYQAPDVQHVAAPEIPLDSQAEFLQASSSPPPPSHEMIFSCDME